MAHATPCFLPSCIYSSKGASFLNQIFSSLKQKSMKKILLICCLVAATNILVYAQGVPVSKSEYAAQVSKLNALLDQNKATEAKAVWEDVHKMMMNEMSNIKYKIKDANAGEKDRLMNVMKNQFAIYSSIIQVREKMVEHKATVKNKLKEFGAGML